MSNNRIATTFAKTSLENRLALITFTMAGDPSISQSLEICLMLAENGADILEIGMPFSDPMADGPTIERAGRRALAAGCRPDDILQLVKNFRKQNTITPIILMGYYNPIYHYGIKRYAENAAKAGVDGFIIVDLPSEEDEAFFEATNNVEIALIKLITPTSSEERIEKIAKRAGGFLYFVSVNGITGIAGGGDADLVKHYANLATNNSKLPLVVGFGIRSAEQIHTLKHIFGVSGVVVGSSLVQIIEKSELDRLKDFVRELRAAC